MKELSIEQKAKAYDEAIEKIKHYVTDECGCTRLKPSDIFPELKESKGENVRKGLIAIITDFDSLYLQENYSLSREETLDWLEKQGERKHQYKSRPRYVGEGKLLGKKDSTVFSEDDGIRKPILDVEIPFGAKDSELEECTYYIPKGYHAEIEDNKVVIKKCEQKPNKVEPKFKVGDWVVQGHNILKIRCVGDEYYCYETIGGYVDDMLIAKMDFSYRPWTIQDAKDGDVLYSIDSKQPFIYKERPQFISQAIVYCCINEFGEFAIWNTIDCVIRTDKYVPATKEQRDLLFQKMREANYEWDAEKKELKELKWGEQKPAWSDDDEAVLSWCISDIERAKYCMSQTKPELCDIEIKWLKNIKDRVQPQSQWKPSDEQMYHLSEAAHHKTPFWDCGILIGLYDELKKLKE